MSESAKHYEEAKQRVKKIKKFYREVIGSICLSAFLVFINLRFSGGFHWFWFPLIGMSIGLITDYIKLFGIPFSGGLLGSDWEERRILEEMKRLDDEEDHIKWLAARRKEQLDLNQPQELPKLGVEKIKLEDNKQR